MIFAAGFGSTSVELYLQMIRHPWRIFSFPGRDGKRCLPEPYGNDIIFMNWSTKNGQDKKTVHRHALPHTIW
jgi:hypothetical protein